MPATRAWYKTYRNAMGFPSIEPKVIYRSLNEIEREDGLDLLGTNIEKSKPFDHFFYDKEESPEVVPHLNIYDLAAQFKDHDLENGEENPLKEANLMTRVLSDHLPIQFFMKIMDDDD